MLLQRLEQRVQAQRFAAGGLELAKVARARRCPGEVPLAEMLVQQLEHLELGAGDAGIVDEIGAAQRLEPRLELRRAHALASGGAFVEIGDRLDVEIEHVAAASGSMDGTGSPRPGRSGKSACSGFTPTMPAPAGRRAP